MSPYSIPNSLPPVAGGAIRKAPLAAGIEYGFWLASFLALGYCSWIWMDARRHQTEGSRMLASASRQAGPNSTAAPAAGRAMAPAYGTAVAKIEVERLGLSTVVFEGTGDDVLSHGAGHLRGSAFPGQAGNVVFAAHRDTFFRALQNLRIGDVVLVESPAGVRRYIVESTRVVQPENTSAFAPSRDSVLTLITCYPFRYIGSAPERFVARCRQAPPSS
jgi:sortase A